MTLYISPYRRFATLRQAMDRLLEESLSDTTSEREMMLAVDVTTAEDDYTIKALVPGLEAEDLNIEVLNNTVTIRGEFKPTAGEDEKFLTCELPSGSFSRVVTLPTALDPSKAEASIKNGVLLLRVPKAESHRPKSIKVSTN
ncbi:MAG: Hsp20/alpha crystallin family protein [Chloroflexi bacterium]|nr:MAG: Hsp20/alpha crystallin family protein [Chloroflexota bacterium]